METDRENLSPIAINSGRNSPARAGLSPKSPDMVQSEQSYATKPKLPTKTSPSLRRFQQASERRKGGSQLSFSPNKMWSEALQGLRKEQEERSVLERQKNLAVVEDGVASKRINQFKDMILQQQPNVEERAECWKLLKDFLNDPEVLYEVDRHLSRGPERFVLGDTHLYAAANISFDLNLFLHKIVDSREKYFPLLCGVRCERKSKYPIKVLAMAAKGMNDQFYVAVMIKSLLATNIPPDTVFGLTDVLFLSNEDRSSKIAEKTFELVAHTDAEWDDFTYYEEDDGYLDDVDNCKEERLSLEDSGKKEKEGGDVLQSQEKEVTEVEDFGNISLHSPYHLQMPSVETDSSEHSQEEDFADDLRILDIAPISLPPRGLDNSQSSTSEAVSLPLPLQVAPLAVDVVTTSWHVEGNLLSSRSHPSCALVPLDITAVKETGSCDKLFVAATESSTLVISNNMKYFQADTKCVVEHNRAYEWIRGTSMAGWLYKWPSKYNGFGQPHRRYFILRDNLLCYYTSRPLNDADYQRVKIFYVTEDTQLELCTRMFTRCLKISVPAAADALWIRFPESGRQESLWLHALQQSIALQSTKRLSLSSTIKTVWYPDVTKEGTYDIISVDATMVNDGKYVKVALFQFQRDSASRTGWTGTDQEAGEAQFNGEMHVEGYDKAYSGRVQYSMDIIANEVEKMQIELVLTNEMPLTQPSLRCVKIYGDKILLGGAGAFLAVGMIGRTTDLSFGPHRRVLYVLPVSQQGTGTAGSLLSEEDSSPRPEPISARFGHNSDAEIRFFAWAELTDIFVAGDDCRTLSFWFLPKEQTSQELVTSPNPSSRRPGYYYGCRPEFQSIFSLSQVDPERRFADERITALTFLKEHTHLLVSTTKRLLLLEVAYMPPTAEQRRRSNSQSSNDHRFGVVGYIDVDTVERSDQLGLFALNVIDPVQQQLASLINLQSSSNSSTNNNNNNGNMSTNINNSSSQSHNSHSSGSYRQSPLLVEKRLSHRSSSFMEKRIVFWRLTSEEVAEELETGGKKSEEPEQKHCLLSRQEWSNERFASLLRSIQPVPTPNLS